MSLLFAFVRSIGRSFTYRWHNPSGKCFTSDILIELPIVTLMNRQSDRPVRWWCNVDYLSNIFCFAYWWCWLAGWSRTSDDSDSDGPSGFVLHQWESSKSLPLLIVECERERDNASHRIASNWRLCKSERHYSTLMSKFRGEHKR